MRRDKILRRFAFGIEKVLRNKGRSDPEGWGFSVTARNASTGLRV